jgi:hypothetical protein
MDSEIELNNPELVTISLFNLGGAFQPVDLEDIAIYVYSLAPKRFGWKKFEDRIDLRIVMYSVNDAIKPDIGFITGDSRHGYMLTQQGIYWLENKINDPILINSARKLSNSDLLDKEKDRLRRTKAVGKFLLNQEDQINIIDFREFVRVNDNFPKSLRDQKFAKIQNVTDQDETLKKVWDYLREKFISER